MSHARFHQTVPKALLHASSLKASKLACPDFDLRVVPVTVACDVKFVEIVFIAYFKRLFASDLGCDAELLKRFFYHLFINNNSNLLLWSYGLL